MAILVDLKDQDGKAMKMNLWSLPDVCPVCSTNGQPEFIQGAMNYGGKINQIYAIFKCPVNVCRGLYIAVYQRQGGASDQAKLVSTSLGRYTKKAEFEKNLSDISPDFCEIYNQALTAEDNELNQICGPGYRKALEFLVKDFLVKHKFKSDPAKHDEVRKSFLATVIKNFIDQERIKQCAERATWLGNDETHYLRKWAGKDIQDLKSLIQITAGYFNSEIEADRYLNEMPAPAKS